MIERKPDIDTVTRAARSEICPHCPLRWGPDRKSLDDPSLCELQCDLFKHLPTIRRIAACADPMLEPISERAEAAIDERVPMHHKRTSPLWRNRNRLVAFITRLFGE
jgi:hypothetical protein